MIDFLRYSGGPPVPRKLISQGDCIKRFNVEVYPLSLKLTDSRDNTQLDMRLSKKVINARIIPVPLFIP